MLLVKTLFFAGLKGASLPRKALPGFDLFENFKLINNPAEKNRMIAPFLTQIGTLERDFLINSDVSLIYEKSTVEVEEHAHLGERANGLVVAKLAKIQNWLNQIWIVKDHAINHDVGFQVFLLPDESQVTSNTWEASFSKSDGSNEDTPLNFKEIEAIRKLDLKSEYGDDVGPLELHRPGYHGNRTTKLDDTGARIQRFLYFTTGARASQDIAIKVALYSSAMEALVSSSHSEIIHQVAERTAIILSENIDQRLQAYRSVKRAYAMRSKAVHGAAFSSKSLPKLIESSVALDQICRELAEKIFIDSDFRRALTFQHEEFSEYWLRKIFA